MPGREFRDEKSSSSGTAHSANRAAALRGLARSVFINVVCTYILYRLLAWSVWASLLYFRQSKI
jgi:hypothetical protein